MEHIRPDFLNVAQVGIESPLKIQWDDLDPRKGLPSHQGSPHWKNKNTLNCKSASERYMFASCTYIYICMYIYMYTLIIFIWYFLIFTYASISLFFLIYPKSTTSLQFFFFVSILPTWMGISPWFFFSKPVPGSKGALELPPGVFLVILGTSTGWV